MESRIERYLNTGPGNAAILDPVFDAAVTAFEAGAWVGPTGSASDATHHMLLAWRASAHTLASGVLDEFRRATTRQPDTVGPTDWQYYFRENV